MASDREKKYLLCLAEDIQVFMLTMDKSGKESSKKSLIGDEWMENGEWMTYLIDNIRENLKLLNLEFVDTTTTTVDNNVDDETQDDTPLTVRGYRSFELKLSEERIRTGKKFKLPVHYFFRRD
jgi:hypothetical protein